MANIVVPETEPPVLFTDSMESERGCYQEQQQPQINEQESVEELLAGLLSLHGKLVAALAFDAVRAEPSLLPVSPGTRMTTSSSDATKSLSRTSASARPSSAGRPAFSPGNTEYVDSLASRRVRENLSLSQEEQDDDFVDVDEDLHFPLQPQLIALEKRSQKAGKKTSNTRSMKTGILPTALPVIERKSRYVLQPSSKHRLYWDALTLVVLLQDMILSPLHVFEVDAGQEMAQRSWILASDVFWSLDVVVSFFTAVHVDGTLVQNRVGIAKAYMKSWLPFDLCILVPDLLSVLLQDRESWIHILGVMRFIRIGRLVRLLRFVRLLRILKLTQIVESLMLRGFVSNSWRFALDVGKYLASMLYGLHLLACLWYWAGNVPNGWVQEEDLSALSLSSRYFASLTISLSRLPASSMRWNMSLQTDGERTLAIIATFFALGMSSVCVSKVTNVMARWQSTRQQKQQTMQSLREYCTSHGIDVSQILSMKRYAERELARKAAYEAHTNLLQTFSSSMLKTLLHQARRSFLHYHKDFAAWCAKSDVLEFNICNKAMKEQYNMKYDSIFMASDHAEGMYLMATAQCSYEFDTMPIMPRFGTNPASNPGTRCCLWRLLSKPVDELEENIVRLGSGDFISEHALWVTGWSHRGRLQVIADGWVLALPTCSLMETLKEQPNVIECVVSFAKKYAQALNLMTESNDEKLSDLPFCTESENGSSRGLNSRGLNSRGLNSRGLKSHRLQGRSVLPKPIP